VWFLSGGGNNKNKFKEIANWENKQYLKALKNG